MTVQSWAGAARLISSSFLYRTPVALAVSVALCAAQPLAAAESAGAPGLELEEVTVTGTRIRMVTGMDTPTPVAALSAEELMAMSPASITEALVQLPQFYGGATAENFGQPGANNFFQSPGGGSLNLRGIGSKRTLTLLDSRRVVPATAFGGPDINMFPDQMLKRIETVTGGASAAYGTDAVSGVVNYILDTSFEGVRGSLQAGTTERGDGENQKYSLAFGHALGERAHVLLSAGYSKQEEIVGYQDRNWYQGCGLMQNPAVPANVNATDAATYVPGNGGYSPETPRLIPACDLHTTTSTYDGLFTIAGQRYELQPDGSAIPFVRTLPATGPAANSSVMSGGGGQNYAETDTSVLPYSSRKNVFAYVDYDVSDSFTVFAQGMFSWQTLRQFGRVGDFLTGPPQQFTIYRDNAFLPASVATLMDNAGAASFEMTRGGTREDWGWGSFANINRTGSATLGFKGNLKTGGFLDGWSVDGYFQYGKNKLDAVQEGGIRLDRVYLATDAIMDGGTARCRITVMSGQMPDCVPLNVFGRGNAGTAGVDWIKGFDPGVAVTVNPFLGFDSGGQAVYGDPYSYVGDEDKHRLLTLEQKVFEIATSGKVFDGWAGPISAAVGAHWRKESIDQKVQASQGNSAADPTYRPVWCPDAALTQPNCVDQVARGIRPAGNLGIRGVPSNPYNNIVEMQFSNVPFVSGAFDVTEVFAETIVPLVADQSWMRNLNLQGAVRWADYAGSGAIWSYKAGIDAAFTDEIRLRGTYSHDTRAANIAERFDRTGGFTLPINDRVSPLPDGWTNPTAVTTVNGGDPSVAPEEADTFTVGMVYRPLWLPGFDVSVDWLQVSLEGAIEQLQAQRVIDMCYLEGDQDQCARISRDPVSNIILFVPQTFQNLSESYHESIDLEIGYTRPVSLFGGNERVGLRLFGSYLIENSTTNSQGVKTDSTGSLPFQYFKRKASANLSYNNGPLSLTLAARYNGGGELSTSYNQYRDALGGVLYDVADNTVGSSVYWDTRFGYQFDVGGETSVEVFGNVTNLFNRDAPYVLAENLSTQTGGGYDVLGRRYVVGFNLRF